MIKLTVEGKLLSVGRNEFPSKCKILIGIPDSNGLLAPDDELAPEYIPLEFQVSEETAIMFAPHILDRVRVDFNVIPTPKIVDDEKPKKSKRKKKKASKSKVRSSGKADRLQDDDQKI